MIAAIFVLASVISGPIEATVLRVHDGDTLRVRAYIWPEIESVATVRIRGIDAPEIKGRCARERELARAARDLLRERTGERVTLSNVAREKYGRSLADVTLADGSSAAELLLAAGLARPYDGGRRGDWCAVEEAVAEDAQ